MAFRSPLVFLAIAAVYSAHALTFRWESEVAPTDKFNGQRRSEKDTVNQDDQNLMGENITPWCQCILQSCSCCVDRDVTVDGKNGRMSVDADIRECFPVSSKKHAEICFGVSKNANNKWCAALYATTIERGQTKTEEQALGCFDLPK